MKPLTMGLDNGNQGMISENQSEDWSPYVIWKMHIFCHTKENKQNTFFGGFVHIQTNVYVLNAVQWELCTTVKNQRGFVY